MATQVSYKGSTITSFTNTSKTLKTSGKYMEDDVIVSESISLQSKVVAPTTTALTVTADSGYEGLSSVTVESAGGGATFIWDEEDSHGGTIRYISTGNSVSGTSNITANGTYTVASYYSANVNVIPSLQSKSVNPSESVQTVSPDSNYVGLSSVSVGAISSTYVGSGITTRSSIDLSVSGATVIVPSGYYASSASKAIPNGSATTPATSITANPSVSINTSTGVVTATTSKSQNITPTVSAGYVSSGTAGTVTVSGSSTLQLTVQSGTTVSPTESEQTAVAAGKYTTGAVKVGAISSNYVGSNITTNPNPTVSGDTVTIPKGYYSANTSKSVASGTAGTPTASKGTVSGHSVSVTPSVTNVTGYITGGTKTGTAVSVSASELVSGTYNVTSSGTKDVTNYASASVPAGTEGTPTATKGTVSNYSVSVTPSVTNTSGFISGSTKTGTAVTVTASELVSGSQTITTNSTYDVTNLSQVVVNVSGSGGVTQDANGYIVLPSTGGGGSGGTWSWMGENPTLVKDYGTTKTWFKDTGYATWTPSTTSTKIADSVNLEACTGMNFDDYDYLIVGKVHSHFEYGSGATGTAQPSDYYIVYYNYIYGINSNKENMDNGTINNATSRSINGQSGLFYLNTSGVQSFGNYSYGVTVYTAPSLTINYPFGTVTPKSPQMNAVCNASYFSTGNAAAVNQNTSYYEYRVLIYRVNHWTSDGGNIWGLMRDMWLNGI